MTLPRRPRHRFHRQDHRTCFRTASPQSHGPESCACVIGTSRTKPTGGSRWKFILDDLTPVCSNVCLPGHKSEWRFQAVIFPLRPQSKHGRAIADETALKRRNIVYQAAPIIACLLPVIPSAAIDFKRRHAVGANRTRQQKSAR